MPETSRPVWSSGAYHRGRERETQNKRTSLKINNVVKNTSIISRSLFIHCTYQLLNFILMQSWTINYFQDWLTDDSNGYSIIQNIKGGWLTSCVSTREALSSFFYDASITIALKVVWDVAIGETAKEKVRSWPVSRASVTTIYYNNYCPCKNLLPSEQNTARNDCKEKKKKQRKLEMQICSFINRIF